MKRKTLSTLFEQYFNTLNSSKQIRYEREIRFVESLHTQYCRTGQLSEKQIKFLAAITYGHEDAKYDYH